MNKTMEELVSFCKQYGFIFPGSEIYGGLANTFDYGPLGVLLKNNIKKAWIKRFVQEDRNNVLLDAAILMNSKVWEASGHITTFHDPLIDCRECKSRYRADKLIEEFTKGEVEAGGFSNQQLIDYIHEHHITCPKCKALNYTDIRQFNLMFKTNQGVVEDNRSEIYLRPETAQGIFTNFLNVQRSMRRKIPFGIGQVGKSFRNEITPGNFIFRTREFEQMEMEFFCKPGSELTWFEYFKNYCQQFLFDLGINQEHLRLREHEQEELSFYSNATVDIEYQYPFGWGELWGIASRTNYDLSRHQEVSTKSMEYLDPDTNERYIPYVIEPSVGVERLLLAVLADSYDVETLENQETREVLHFHPCIAPYQIAIFPLVKKYHQEKAQALFDELSQKDISITYDETGTIGKRYRRQDAIGTPFCITVDDETLKNNTVTIRHRDTMEQVVLPVDEVMDYIQKYLNLSFPLND